MRHPRLFFAFPFSSPGGSGASSGPSSGAQPAQRPIRIERVEPIDAETLEAWENVTEDLDLLFVGSYRRADPVWSWRVDAAVMEFVRQEPLESEMARAMARELGGIPGVRRVLRRDREVWTLQGDPDGASLARAAAAVVHRFLPATRAIYDALETED